MGRSHASYPTVGYLQSESLAHREKALGVNKTMGLLFCMKDGSSPAQALSVLKSCGCLKLPRDGGEGSPEGSRPLCVVQHIEPGGPKSQVFMGGYGSFVFRLGAGRSKRGQQLLVRFP